MLRSTLGRLGSAVACLLAWSAVNGAEPAAIEAPPEGRQTQTGAGKAPLDERIGAAESEDNKPSLPGLGTDKEEGGKASETPLWRGFLQQETGFTYAAPAHWSTAVVRAQLGTSGRVGDNLKWKVTLRGDADPVYAFSDFYPERARHDQRLYGIVGETYVDTSLKGWDLRVGRQNIVWGEMVGLFFADVVTAKDLRHFVLPSFDVIRIPQWAVRGEYFWGDSHVELVWIPFTTFDRIGRPGSEFFPFQSPAPAGFTQVFLDDKLPARTLTNSNVGARFSTLQAGWDLSAFFYRSMDSSATFVSQIAPTSLTTGTITYTPRHDRIWQFGGTVSKDYSDTVVFKGEAVYTSGRSFNVTDPTQPWGVIQKDTLDYAVGVDVANPDESRLNLQVFQRVFSGHDTDMLLERLESGATLLYNQKLPSRIEAEIIWIQSLNRWENLIRPRIIWKPEQNLRIAFGVDVFNGPITGALGRFSSRDRVYVESRYDF